VQGADAHDFGSQLNFLLAPVSAWALCSPKFLAGTMSLGELTQAAAAFVAVQSAFNWLVDNYPRLADCSRPSIAWRTCCSRWTRSGAPTKAETPGIRRNAGAVPTADCAATIHASK
jgi:hypothetical protein